ncbi:MAG: SMP-30/gluconolactonase/LRE family protein [Methylophilaceae bacterium]|nr:SMP-30/gluconolactonase/LRE family protein [Methylophilaceae bacterium]
MSKKFVPFITLCLLWAGPVWAERVVTGLKNPESVLVTAGGRIYVSEIGEFGKDGDGRISLIEGGRAKPFATGMDDPKGLAMIGDALYVADKTRILKVERNGKWRVFVPADAFPAKPQFLNDLAADKSGNLYVSDSGDLNGKGGAVYRISPQGKVSVVVSDEDKRVLAPNGLLPEGEEKMLMVDFFSGVLYRITLKTGGMVQVAEGFGGGDGLARDRRGVLWISDWKNGRVFSLKKDGTLKLVKAGYQSAADIALSPDGKFILVPDMKAGELHWLPAGD